MGIKGNPQPMALEEEECSVEWRDNINKNVILAETGN